MSDVYRALDEVTGSYVAVKIVRSSDLHYGERLAQEARALERFEHPGLARLLDVGMTGDMAFLVMEYVDGTSLAERLRQGPLSAAQSADLGAALSEALNYIHQLGVVHRDVKPANILIDQAGRPRLTDFGIARLSDSTTMTLMGTTLGTASYMAPEQFENHQVGPAADIWSLAMVLDECLTGRRFYEGTPSEVIARRLSGTTPDTSWLPRAWRLLLAGMLERDPAKRLSALDVSSLIVAPAFRVDFDPVQIVTSDSAETQVLGVVPPVVPVDGSTMIIAPTPALAPRTRPGPGPRRRRPGQYWWAFAALALVLLGSGLAYGLSSGSTPTTTTSSTTSSTSTTTTTTTTVPVGSSTARALTSILSDLASAEAAGTIDVATAQPIGDLAQQAVADNANASPDLAASDLQQAAALVVNGVGAGSITQGVATALDRDLNALATALGVSAATPTTQPASPGPGGPGPGNGKGHGHGNAN